METSGSGLPTGNKKNSFKEIHVGFLVEGKVEEMELMSSNN